MQLFICHTQYNLILAAGISNSDDDLILFIDFNLGDTQKRKLENRFQKCLFLQGNYPLKNRSKKEKFKKIDRDNQAIKKFIRRYDRIFIVDDMCIQEMFALKCSFQHNHNVEMAWLEDGANAYFWNGVISSGMGATPFKRFIRKHFFSIRYGLYGFYDLASCMGGHKRLSSAYVTFPNNVRRELKNKNLVSITDEQFYAGMRLMFGADSILFEPGGLLIAMDKLDVYGDKLSVVDELINKLVNGTTSKVYYKYHPRETDTLPSLRKCIELDRTVALEYYLTNASTRDLTIIGIKSTALQTAKKMGFKTVSLIQQVEDTGEVVNFYKSIGIVCE